MPLVSSMAEFWDVQEGRSSNRWVDFDLYGHQIVTHLAPALPVSRCQTVMVTRRVPVPHFGVMLPMDDWRRWRINFELKA